MIKKILLSLLLAVIAAGSLAYVNRAALISYFFLKPNQSFDANNVPLKPNYGLSTAWLALPDLADYADIAPVDSKDNQATADADVFYVHPTTYISNAGWNAAIDEPLIKITTEQGVLKHQTSVFNGCCRVYAPKYRQATFYFNNSLDSEDGRSASELAHEDVRAAFLTYLEQYNNGRPLIIASHSQGSRYALRILEEFFNEQPLENILVGAYVIGLGIAEDKFKSSLSSIPLCEAEDDLGCMVAYTTMEEGAGPGRFANQMIHYANGYESNSDKRISCVNPLSWRRDEVTAGPEQHLGAIGYALDSAPIATVEANLVSATCRNGTLYISKPNQPGFVPRGFNPQDYHTMDYSLFYMNLRENAIKRVNAFMARRQISP